MIVVKFGGSSVADAERIAGAARIVAAGLERRPIVVVSALGGVTDLLVRAIDLAAAGRRDEIDPILADLERRHRWALAACETGGRRRQDLGLTLDAGFEDLRQRLRSVRVLGEATPRARDALLAFGELLASRLLAAALAAIGVDAEWVDAGEVVRTDDRHGEATADPEATRAACRTTLAPLVERGRVPVLGGFTGSSADGTITTLGRGGGDTSAAVVGSALEVEEIQIWTDVDGLMTADPRWVPEARTLRTASFAEAAELAYYGAKVLHPASIEPAVRRDIPVVVRSTRRPAHPGTRIVRVAERDAPGPASIASRDGIRLLRVVSPTLSVDPEFFSAVAGRCRAQGVTPDLVASSEIGIALAVREGPRAVALESDLGACGRLEARSGMAVLCVVGEGLARDAGLRAQVLAAIAPLAPEALTVGGSGTAIAAVVPAAGLADQVRQLHGRFFPGGDAP